MLAGLLLPFVILLAALGWGRSDESSLLVFAPFLLWAVTIPAAWYVADQQVGRHLRRLARVAQACATGETPLALAPEAPAEILALAESLREVAGRIAGHERQLHEAIESQDAMVREVHHRVKNNMQIVTSLLSLQAKVVQGEAAQRAFGDVQTRVRALALVHRYLYESKDLQSVNLGAFLKELSASLQLAYGASEQQVIIEIEADAVWDVADRAVPLALFMTEAMTNALKHAFPQGRQGIIRIVLKAVADSMVRFSVEDNGIGLSEAQAIAQGAQASLGMSLIKAFARQVDGRLTITGPPGTVVMIEFANRIPPAGDHT